MTTKVFLSSTAKDLREHREGVYKGLRRLEGFQCVRMEDWGADERPPRALCEQRVRETGLFVGILGHCYGSRPPDDPRSYTEIEYDTARGAGLPCLMFVAPDDFA